MNFKGYFKNICNESFGTFQETSTEIMQNICKDRGLIIKFLNNIANDDNLIEKSECYDFLDKLVCFADDELGVYMRLSLFNSKYANRIHYHRWHYTANILVGSYTQYFYGIYNDNDITELYPYEPLFVENCNENNIYTLNNKVIHSIKAKPDTISLCIRGKALLDKFQAIDVTSNSSWFQYGANLEASEERNMKAIDKKYLLSKIQYVQKILEKENTSNV